jgi:biotin carboxylase
MSISPNKKILIIGSGWEQLSLVEEIKKQGHYLIATHPNIHADGFKLADQYYVKDSRDISGHIRIAETHKIDAIVTDNCDFSFYTASIVASKLKLPFASIQSAVFSNDKFAQREAVGRSNVKQPVYQKVRTIEELIAASKIIMFPAILKPVDSRGTFGVSIIQSDKQLINAFYDAIDNSYSRTLILEQFISGTLVTVDGFCFSNGHQSLTVASRKFEEGPKPVTKEIIYPALFKKSINEALMKAHHQVVEALNYTTGHTHGEYILTNDNKIYLVECTNRGGGVYTSSVIVPLLTEYPINEILVNQALGSDDYAPANLGIESMKKAVILTFIDYEVGKVIDKINIEYMQKLPYVVRFRSKYSTNEMIESIENGAGRHSMLVLSASNTDQIIAHLQEFKNKLHIVYH